MKNKNIKLPIFLAVLSLLLLCFCNTSAYASDYKYKVLDTKYNPSAQKLLDGSLEKKAQEIQVFEDEQKGFDFLRFIGLLAAFLFPAVILKYSCKTFVKVFAELKEKGIDYIPEEETETQQSVQEIVAAKDEVSEQVEEIEQVEPAVETVAVQESPVEKTVQEKISSKAVTAPIKSKKTVMINKARLMRNKGLCLVQYDNIYALMGYINNKVFLLQKFNELKSKEIRPRWTETVNDKERYIVRLGTAYKALVEVGDEDINLLIEL